MLVCMAHLALIGVLDTTLGERQMVTAVDIENRRLEMFVSKETGSWTLVVEDTKGQYCIITAGTKFKMIKE